MPRLRLFVLALVAVTALSACDNGDEGNSASLGRSPEDFAIEACANWGISFQGRPSPAGKKALRLARQAAKKDQKYADLVIGLRHFNLAVTAPRENLGMFFNAQDSLGATCGALPTWPAAVQACFDKNDRNPSCIARNL